MTNKISLIEDHQEALKIWRERGFKNLDLVHIDAHIDFGFYSAKPIEWIINEVRGIKELKRDLEYSLAFRRYEKDFDKQTNIGNYIYPAMEEGIVKDFYWVVPGGLKEYKKSYKVIKNILKNFSRQDPYQLGHTSHVTRHTLRDGIISTELLGRKFVICTLEKLPILKRKVLLDIDTDFLVMDSLLNANNTDKIDKRKCWIRPDRLVKELLNKELRPVLTTVAYSVNGGYTPIHYKVLGDELAYRLSPRRFKEHFTGRLMASTFFDFFESTGKKEYYQKAIKLNPSYRAADNNYGAFYLSIRKFSKAKKEFLRIVKVDPKNPYPFAGLGEVYLQRKDLRKARQCFSYALRHKKDLPSALFGLAQAEFRLNNLKKAKSLLLRYQKNAPLQPQSRYILGCIYEKQGNFKKAVMCYQDAMRLGLNNIEVISRLLKNAWHLKARYDIIHSVISRYREFKRGFLRIKRLSAGSGRKVKGLQKIRKKMAILEKRLRDILMTDVKIQSTK